MRITQHAPRNAVSDRFPRLAVVLCLVNERIAVIHLVEIDRQISSAGFVPGRLDVADCTPRRQVRNVLRYVSPIFAAIARQLDQAVIGSYPDQSYFFGRLSNREDG